jgi:hypothetical protein
MERKSVFRKAVTEILNFLQISFIEYLFFCPSFFVLNLRSECVTLTDKKNKYSVLNECSRMLKYNIFDKLHV